MFREFACMLGSFPSPTPPRINAINIGAQRLFEIHPIEQADLLDFAWDVISFGTANAGLSNPRVAFRNGSDAWIIAKMLINIFRTGVPLADWSYHLIYAYMIENTRLYEIFRRVIKEFAHGEKFGPPNAITRFWLRNTEQLFYQDQNPFTITNLTSYVRPDLNSTRRNTYMRMFGMDLNHGMDDGKPHPYIKADSSNTDFVSTFEELLREVWVAYSNRNNQTGANPVDIGKMRDLAQKLEAMLLARREEQRTNLGREEFTFVSMMSWFHLTLEVNTPPSSIVDILRAQADTEEQKLFKIAERVGLPAHGLSRSFFRIADPIARVLRRLENQTFNSNVNATSVELLFEDLVNIPAAFRADWSQQDMLDIITHWSIITGRDIKARKVTTT